MQSPVMTPDEARSTLEAVMTSAHSEQKPIADDPMFPLHAIWNSYPFASNEHYAVACALGQGLDKQPHPVKKTRPFFDKLLAQGPLNKAGHASEALEAEVQLFEAMNQIASQMADADDKAVARDDKDTTA